MLQLFVRNNHHHCDKLRAESLTDVESQDILFVHEGVLAEFLVPVIVEVQRFPDEVLVSMVSCFSLYLFFLMPPMMCRLTKQCR